MPKGVVRRVKKDKKGTSGTVKTEEGSYKFYNFPGKVESGTKVMFKTDRSKGRKKDKLVRELNGIKLPHKT